MGLTFNNNKRQRVIKDNPREKLFISINWNTNIVAYLRKQNPGSTRFLSNQWNLLSINRYTLKLRLNLGPFSNNSNTKHISNRKPTSRLHNSTISWDTYRQIIYDKVNLLIKIKKHEGIETNNLLSLIQHAAKEAAPNSDPQRTTNNIPYEIKGLVSEKGRAKSIWQRTHTPDSRRLYSRTSNTLKSKLQEMRNESFEKYVSNLKRDDNSIWKPIKNRRNPKTTSPPIRKYLTPRRAWAISDKEMPELFAEHLKFSLHIIMTKTRKWNKTQLRPFKRKNALKHLL
jgi:hypothetical protein